MSIEVQVFDRLLEISVLLHADMARSFAGTGLTTSRVHLLWELRRLGPSTQQALASALQVSPRNVTGLVDALESHGYLERHPHPTDRRAVRVTLTDLGERTMAAMESDREQAAAALTADLSEAELDQFGRALGTVADRLRRLVDAPDASERYHNS
ncbi:MarR family transcriptional regulator [Actinoplanes sp. NPDC051633]|uniref:MarR family winged helix-turn-helix transcriptional regulator n=1 Tax=Actinoplanes sp. NPDC051633 TaxID=3155670 RepID=UPI00342189C5